MRAFKYDHEYSRRQLIAPLANSAAAAGVLMPSRKAITENGVIAKAYPRRIAFRRGYGRGRIKTGDEVNASTLEVHVIRLDQVSGIDQSPFSRRNDLSMYKYYLTQPALMRLDAN